MYTKEEVFKCMLLCGCPEHELEYMFMVAMGISTKDLEHTNNKILTEEELYKSFKEVL